MTMIKEGYKETEIGVIPEDWEIKKLIDCFNIYGGHSIPRDQLAEKGAYYIHYGDIHTRTNSYICTNEDSSWLPKVQLSKTKHGAALETGDLVFADASEDYNGVGKSIVVFNNGHEIVAGLHTMVGKEKFVLLDTHFKRYFLQTNLIKKQFKRLATGSKVYGITKGNLGIIKFCVPPLPEQQRIAEILSTTDEHIEKLDKTIEDYQLLKKGMMKKLLTEGIGHTEFKETEIGRIPKEWEVIRFFDCLTDFIDFRGRTPKKIGMDWSDDGIMALSALNVKMGRIDFSIPAKYGTEELYNKWMTRGELKKHDILMTMEAPLGNIALVPDDNKYILSQRVVALKTKDNIENIFLYYYLLSPLFQNFLNASSTGSTAKGISQKNLEKGFIVRPNYEEQLRIGNILYEIDNRMNLYADEREDFTQLKKALMEQLLTGKIRVKDIS